MRKPDAHQLEDRKSLYAQNRSEGKKVLLRSKEEGKPALLEETSASDINTKPKTSSTRLERGGI